MADAPRIATALAGSAESRWGIPAALVLALGLAALVVPTMLFVAGQTWTGETGTHAPIILATGLWLLVHEMRENAGVFAKPDPLHPILLLLIVLPFYIIARVTQIVEIEGYLMYACLVVVLWSFIGWQALRRLWFPLLYLTFIFPPPESLVALVTLPLKLWISQAAVSVLAFAGYPIGGQGVTISIGQYLMLVEAACAGLNTLLTLSAISLFYAYVRHRAQPRHAALLALLVVPVALFANFIRVILLILLTYHFGEATGQGFMHNFAGLFMFALALGTMFGLDALLQRYTASGQPAQPRDTVRQ